MCRLCGDREEWSRASLLCVYTIINASIFFLSPKYRKERCYNRLIKNVPTFHWLQSHIRGSSRPLRVPAKISLFLLSNAHNFTTIVCLGTIRTLIPIYVTHTNNPGLPGHSSSPNPHCYMAFTYLFWWHLPLLPDSWNPSTETWGTSSATSPIILATSWNVIFLLYSKPNFQNQALPHTWPQEVATSSTVALSSLVLMSLLLHITTGISFSFLPIKPQLWISQDIYFLQTQHPSSFPLNIYCWSVAIPYKTTLVNILGDFNIHADNPSNSLASSLTLFPKKILFCILHQPLIPIITVLSLTIHLNSKQPIMLIFAFCFWPPSHTF